MLLNAISSSRGGGARRILLPEGSLVDRVRDCRVRNWPDVIGGQSFPGDLEEEEEMDYETCRLAVTELMGEMEEQRMEVAVSGTAGMKIGFIDGGIEDHRWRAIRREEKCLRD